MAGMEPSVEEKTVKVEAAMPEAADEAVDPEAGRDGDDVYRARGHEPQHRHGRGAESCVEEVGGMGVAGVGPSANGLRLSVVVLVHELIQCRKLVYHAVGDVVGEVGEGEHNGEHNKPVDPVQLVHVEDDRGAVPHGAYDEERDERQHNEAVEPNVPQVGAVEGLAGPLPVREVLVPEKADTPRGGADQEDQRRGDEAEDLRRDNEE